MKLWDLINPFWTWIALALLIVLGYSYYQFEEQKRVQSEIQSQLLQQQAKVLKEQYDTVKKTAQDSDLKILEMAKTTEEAKQKIVFEHATSEALKKKLAILVGPSVPLPPVPSSDPIVLRDQIIAQQDTEIQSQQVVIDEQGQQITQLTLSRDIWKAMTENQEQQLDLNRKALRAQEIATNTARRAGLLREGKGILEGGALVFALHLMKLF